MPILIVYLIRINIIKIIVFILMHRKSSSLHRFIGVDYLFKKEYDFIFDQLPYGIPITYLYNLNNIYYLII